MAGQTKPRTGPIMAMAALLACLTAAPALAQNVSQTVPLPAPR